ncbi:DUF1194 domain-containing protein [Kaistia geumhonensis]|uniref:Threonine dehydrogenase-like Zn-dependent dehydrogenase n=1 Tax=Kaistia geumhonensis TaxID=410839 RepID=A0ABU0M3U7_9HYPH|nr:DUF1194 domain-containing protein [Kaistia geumhonensis]MCX5479167.1 DUF1194 domain-containing protein [Kaistia geumhonensis]MDQ0515613.1 threonine dehydrogenase-like Zn-dependent dehydrogenase [Kaistia geumhonensis]
MRTLLIALLVALAFPALAEEVDVELVLAADGSGSIDDDELALQRRGYAEAITSAEVLAAIGSGPVGAIAITYVEWGGAASQHTIVDWHVVRDGASAAVFADKLVASPRQAYGYNSISGAIAYAADRIRENGYEGLSKVIDVSGDGPQIGGPPLAETRAAALAEGITINGLVIARPGGGVRGPGGMSLSEHYARDVIGGPASFVMVAEGTDRFADAVRRKLIQEIALADPPLHPRSTATR